jgi:hypothetical protein
MSDDIAILRPLLRTPPEAIHIVTEEWEFIQVPVA